MISEINIKLQTINKVKNIIQRFIRNLVQFDIITFIIIFFSLSLPNFYEYLKIENYKYLIYIFFLYYLITYLITFFLNLSKYIKIFKPLIVFIGLSIFLINIFCLKVFNSRISFNIIETIRGSNLNEIIEFFETYFTFYTYIIISLIILLFIIICYSLKKTSFYLPKKFYNIFFILFIISNLMILHNKALLHELDVWKFKFGEVIDLTKHRQNPKVIMNPSIKIDFLVVILGESFSKYHSNLYGYNLNTNPNLLKRELDKDLIIFTNVKSPSPYTSESFKYILNTKRLSDNDENMWYDSLNLIEILNEAGFETIWLSNQEQKGIYDNIPSSYSKLSNKKFFTNSDIQGDKFDGLLLDYELEKKNQKEAIFYHLMGQHPYFEKRYPKEFTKFKPNMYDSKYNQSQSIVLSNYDNATLYNDFIIDSIIKKYEKYSSIIFYFSDHGLDLYQTKDNYAGHARNTIISQEICKDIPFMVYVSKQFRLENKEIIGKLNQLKDKNFCTDGFTELIIDCFDLDILVN